MRTGHFPGKTAVLLATGLALLAAAPLTAQTNQLGVNRPAGAPSQRLGIIGIGPFGRIGSLPRAFDQGIPVALEATVQWPIFRALQLATSADLTVQRISTISSLTSADLTVNRLVHRPYSFDVVHFGKSLLVHSLSNAPGEIGKLLAVLQIKCLTMLLDQKKPVTTPRHVPDHSANALHVYLHAFCFAVAGDIFD